MSNKNKSIAVFYHLYAICKWEKIFLSYLAAIVDSGLYSECKKIFIGITYKAEHNLEKFKEICKSHEK